MKGHVATVSGSLSGLGVNVGDGFTFLLAYDDELGVDSDVRVSGDLYFLRTYSVTADLVEWTGTLSALIASRAASPSSSGVKQSWSRPATTLHHNEWALGGLDLTMVTDYASNPGGEAYGWYRYGSADNIGFLLDSVVTGIPVPEPTTAALVLVALGGLAASRLSKRHR
jgi:hypothetical protein